MKHLFTLLFLLISLFCFSSNKAKLLYNSIEKYSDIYAIPKHIAFNIAFLETGYKGPNHSKYNPHRRSKCGAVGPMQIIPRYGKKYGKNVNKKSLMYNIETNVIVSMKMLKNLFVKYKSWEKAVACYHKGNPKPNKYSKYVTTNYTYTNKWVQYKPKDYPDCNPEYIQLVIN